LSFPDHPFDFLPSSFPPSFLCVRLMNDITSSRLHEEATGGGSSAGTLLASSTSSCHARFLSRTVCFLSLFPLFFSFGRPIFGMAMCLPTAEGAQSGGVKDHRAPNEEMEGILMVVVVNSLVTRLVSSGDISSCGTHLDGRRVCR
jgi:hypothetical protein